MHSWEKLIRKVEPYVPGEQPQEEDIVKLNTNENPYPPSPRVEEELRNLNLTGLKRYPDHTCHKLVEELANYYHLNQNQVFVGVGSDDVLAMAFLTFFHGEKPILFPDITYSFYKVWANLYEIPYECPPLDEHFRLRREDYYKENGGIVIANPNAPTSICESVEFIEDILKHNQEQVVIVDEAYIDFGGESAVRLINQYENLLVVQTFSKSRSLAGLRIGYAMGSEKLIQSLNSVKYAYNSYTLNTISILLGTEAVKDDAYFKATIDKIVKTREKLKKELEELGFHVLDSATNFLFAAHKEIPGRELYEALKKNHIYIRYFNLPRIDNYLRITIGTEEEVEVLTKFLHEYIKQ